CVNDPAPLEGASCNDGNGCTDNDVCHAGTCAGTVLPQNCDDGNPCTLDDCDPQGGCTHDAAARDGFGCDDQNSCTTQDLGNTGVCRGPFPEAATDGDGYCDRVEATAGCNPDDGAEIPPQPATFAGNPAQRFGEVLMTWAAPGAARPSIATDPSCAAAGTCGPIGFCTAGRIGDPCATDADCAQAAHTCRAVVNFANVPNLIMLSAKMNGVALPPFPPARGCSRQIAVTMRPTR